MSMQLNGVPLCQNSGKKLNVLITAGGTEEDIDKVRRITNISEGALGRAIAVEAHSRGHNVTLLGPKRLPKMTGPLPNGVIHKIFRTTEDLKCELEKLAKEKWDLVIHAAAVSDYKPAENSEGKISSDKDELILRLIPNPKLIKSFREWFGKAFLVGFKLLTNVPAKERKKIALEQLKKNKTNLCFENDISEFGPGEHKARMVTPEGGAIPIPKGTKESVAKAFLDFVEKRLNVNWFKTEFSELIPKEVQSLLPDLVKLAQQSGLLYDHNGNASTKVDNDFLVITPRCADKSKITECDLIVAKVDQNERKIYINNTKKASIDTSVSDALYKKYPLLKAILHTHNPWCLLGTHTSFPYPCGVKEEADEVIKTLEGSSYKDGDSFLVKLIHHGYLLGLTNNLTHEDLKKQWESVVKDFEQHIKEVHVRVEELGEYRLKAIVSKEGIIGWVNESNDGTVGVKLLDEYRNKGYGKELVNKIKEEELTIKTLPECGVMKYYKKHGFEIVNFDGRFYYLN